MDQRAALRRFVSEILSDVGDKTPLTDTDSLLVSGRIDSIEIVRVIQFIEENFAFRMGDRDVTMEDFDTIDGMVAMLERART